MSIEIQVDENRSFTYGITIQILRRISARKEPKRIARSSNTLRRVTKDSLRKGPRKSEMNSNQSELFREFPPDVNPSRDFASFRVGGNIIHVPLSKWKDGRLRGDLSAQDAGEVVSRNEKNFREKTPLGSLAWHR